MYVYIYSLIHSSVIIILWLSLIPHKFSLQKSHECFEIKRNLRTQCFQLDTSYVLAVRYARILINSSEDSMQFCCNTYRYATIAIMKLKKLEVRSDKDGLHELIETHPLNQAQFDVRYSRSNNNIQIRAYFNDTEHTIRITRNLC